MNIEDIIFFLKLIKTKGREDCYKRYGFCSRGTIYNKCPIYDEITNYCSRNNAYEVAVKEIKKLEITNPELVFEAKIIMLNGE